MPCSSPRHPPNGTRQVWLAPFAAVLATLSALSGPSRASLYQGDSRPGSYEMISGHWITGAGQVVVSSRFLEKTGTKVGDTVHVTLRKHTETLRIVGEAFDTSGQELEIHADLAGSAGIEACQ